MLVKVEYYGWMWCLKRFFLLVVYCSHPLLGCRNHEQAAGTDHGGGTVQSMYLQPSLST